MKVSEQEEKITVNYIDLTPSEFRNLRDSLLMIATRTDPSKVVKFLGYEQGYSPLTITVDSDRFSYVFDVRSVDPDKPSEEKSV